MHMDTQFNPRTPISQSSTITFNGTSMTVKEWARRIGISPANMYTRLRKAKYNRHGWTLARALVMPPRTSKRMTKDEFKLWQSLGGHP